MSESRREFPVKVEYEAYVIPVLGIFPIASIAVAIVVCFFMMAGGYLLHIPESIAMTAIFAGGAAAVVFWIMHLRRVHTGRKIVLDDDGITYFHFADDKRFLAWDAIDEFRIMDGTKSDTSGHTEVYVGNKKKMKFEHGDFDFAAIESMVKKRIPNKVKIVEL